MRNLTIKREKSIVACTAKMKVYIEDASSNELVLGSVPCRKLGELKNGEEKTFSIENNAAKVFVIADKLSKDFCNDFITIPAGKADVFLSGKNQFKPLAGNPFYFEGVTDEATLKNRKKGSKTGMVVMIAALIVGMLIGFLLTSGSFSISKPMEFTTNGMHIMLTDEFEEMYLEGLTAYYQSGDVSVFILQEKFSDIEDVEDFDSYTLADYGKAVLENNEFPSSVKLQYSDDLIFFEFQDTSSTNEEYYDYFATIYKTHDSFWLVQFVVHEDIYDAYRDVFMDWAKQIYFDAA